MISAIPAGDAGLLVECDMPPARLAAAIRSAGLPGVIDVVPGARTVLVITVPGRWRPDDLAAAIGALPASYEGADSALVEVPVVYDGPDLTVVARLTGLSTDEVIACHCGPEYVVGWLGFSPGFGYLTGLDQRLHVPRLASPRLSVPGGAVAIAGGLAAVYPSTSPGGWRLLGHTKARMWDPQREPPSLLAPGARVRFLPATAGQIWVHLSGQGLAASAASPAEATHTPVPDPSGPRPSVRPAANATFPLTQQSPGKHSGGVIEIVRPGPLATVQDLGRTGLGAIGVPQSGAADATSLVAANRLAGNPDAAAGLELTLGRAALRCHGDLRLAVTGALAEVTVETPDGQHAQAGFGLAFDVVDGGVVSIGPVAAGLRTYVAVAGGIDTPAVLASQSTDLLSGLGLGPLQAGDRLPVKAARAADPGRPADPGRAADPGNRATLPALGNGARVPEQPGSVTAVTQLPVRGTTTRLRVIAGPRLEWFEADALATLCGSPYLVTRASNRTGLRLDGPPLRRSRDTELPSEGMVTGSVQVPHDGKPILLLADHPTTGGYPVIAVLISDDIGLAAQLRPGDKVQFSLASQDLEDLGVNRGALLF